MYAGKSAASLKRLIEGSGYDQKLIVSGSLESRGFLSRVKDVSSEALNSAVVVSNIKEIHDYDLTKRTLVFVDEVQFLDTVYFWELLDTANSSGSSVDLIMAGMKNCQYATPFEMFERITARIDPSVITELHSPCATCGGEKGTTAIRKQFGESRITDCYAVLCNECAVRFINYNNQFDQVPISKLDPINLIPNESYLNRAYRL